MNNFAPPGEVFHLTLISNEILAGEDPADYVGRLEDSVYNFLARTIWRGGSSR